MTNETKKGIFSKIFKVKNSGCCTIKIEEVHEEEQQSATGSDQLREKQSCCGKRPEREGSG